MSRDAKKNFQQQNNIVLNKRRKSLAKVTFTVIAACAILLIGAKLNEQAHAEDMLVASPTLIQ